MVPKRLDQPDSSPVDIYESSSMPSVKGVDICEVSSEALHLLLEEGINQVCERVKIINSRSWKCLIELMLDVIRVPEGGMQ